MALVKAAPNSGKDKFVNILYNKLEYKEEDQQQIKKMLDAASDKNNVNLPEFVGDIKVAGAAFSIPHCEFEFQKVMYHHQSTTTTTKSNSVKSGTNTEFQTETLPYSPDNGAIYQTCGVHFVWRSVCSQAYLWDQ